MEKRRLLENFESMGMRFKKDDLVIITNDSFLVIYTDEDSLKSVCIEILFKERRMTDLEIDTYKEIIIDKSVEDGVL